MQSFTHLNQQGQANMVDVSDKPDSARAASASVNVLMSNEIIQRINDDAIEKGDLFATARIAGIQAAKKCSELIPLCHPLPLSKVAVDISLGKQGVEIVSTCKTTGKTGVEMEALTAASVAALTVYDMCKAIDKGMVIDQLQLLSKTGGKSGDWSRQE